MSISMSTIFHLRMNETMCSKILGFYVQIVLGNIKHTTSKLHENEHNNIYMYMFQGATIFGNMDFTNEKNQQYVHDFLNGEKAHAVLSDMAPTATGVRELDNANILKLCYSVLQFAILVSRTGACFLVKLWQCGETKKLETDISRFYDNVKIVKPNASRQNSTEIFLLGRGFKGLKSVS